MLQVLPLMKEFQINNIDELSSVAGKICSMLTHKSIICFYGKMGAGKTTLIKEIFKQLGCTDTISSPTFSIVNEYRLPLSKKAYHFDFYRIKSIAEAYDMGYEEYFYSGSPCFIEWPEMVAELLPEDRMNINIQINSDTSRTFIIN